MRVNGQITGLLLRGAPSPNRGGEASLLFVVVVMVAGGVMSLPRTDETNIVAVHLRGIIMQKIQLWI